MTLRTVTQVHTAQRQLEGAGFEVRRPFPSALARMVDPFILLDHMGPNTFSPGEGVGAPDHPHRGFETVTYIIEGTFEHRDSVGNHGVLRPGDVQWMTAGRGVVHSEMPEAEFNAQGGTLQGFQLWVNLPAAQKMVPPRYQDTPSDAMPTIALPNGAGHVKVIAGQSQGQEAVIETRTPILFVHATLGAGGTMKQTVPTDHNGFLYTVKGSGTAGGKTMAEGQIGLLGPGDHIDLEAGPEGWSVLIIAGRPINEPVVQWGPFVMNTEAEIHQAIRDYQAGLLGTIDPTTRKPRVLVFAKEQDAATALVRRFDGKGFDVQATTDPVSAERRLRAGVELYVHDHPGDRLLRLAASSGVRIARPDELDDAMNRLLP